MTNNLPTSSSNALQHVPSIPEAQQTAIACRSYEVAIAAPTMHQLAKAYGPAGVLQVTGAVGFIVNRAMEAFSPQRRMSVDGVALFAERIVEDFPHESLEDIALFMRGAVAGRYGGKGQEGETYGALDLQRLVRWFTEYLEEKAMHRERGEHLLQQQQDKHAAEVIGSIPGLKKAVNEFVIDVKDRSDMVRRKNRIDALNRQLPTMTDDAMREAWKIYPETECKALIQAEAMRRGLMGEEYRAAQLKIDAEAKIIELNHTNTPAA